jgi:hypothetical protein
MSSCDEEGRRDEEENCFLLFKSCLISMDISFCLSSVKSSNLFPHVYVFDFVGHITTNGFGLAEGGEFEIRMFKFTIMFNRIPNAQTYDSAPLLANPCYT